MGAVVKGYFSHGDLRREREHLRSDLNDRKEMAMQKSIGESSKARNIICKDPESRSNLEPYPNAETMRCSIRRYFITSLGIIFLWFFITLRVPSKMEDNKKVMAIKHQVATLAVTWLTVGISSIQRPDRSSLSNTLISLFRASSRAEKKHFTVLVHLADSDLTWLRETIEHISSLFSSQILAGQLLLIHAPSDAYPTVDGIRDDAYHGVFYPKQNVDHAFLMSFATNLSDYFLLIEDNVFCAPNFVTHIHWKVTTMKSNSWALLEFSNMGFLGKLFHSRDLPLLAHFILLFYEEKPLDRLIPHFRTLLVQEKTILCRPFLFYHRVFSSTFGDKQKAKAVKKKDPDSPHNPPGTIFTDMKVFDIHFPWEAYTLDETFFWTYNVSVGNHLTVILNYPVNLRRVQVMTGSIIGGEYALEKGQVELGYDPEGMPQHCTSFTILDHLLEGQMDREIALKHMGSSVSCVRLVVKASQIGGLMIRHIYLWEEKPKISPELKINQ
ncbi:alpha-1,3-mannosyl-glycoprotein 4-beta-N-acetylglucosaminyltransferase-like protein MGAT4E [Choloepus didactylus]|uniref:alpha-1,3-mannosyl-glycoprotein 4-beta-N-acetylglucosaminyltransferase-like protein MGAT4E n=1 Tax=Choloepus didactylus TaxID=27675 RepID=UPI00189F3FA4|nr:alpha-1,3-mannosyl-glycoprotein 4-beta-N-acetylglucosaminyltransferase-like protein MGAT4E [Choloepus didactylus]